MGSLDAQFWWSTVMTNPVDKAIDEAQPLIRRLAQQAVEYYEPGGRDERERRGPISALPFIARANELQGPQVKEFYLRCAEKIKARTLEIRAQNGMANLGELSETRAMSISPEAAAKALHLFCQISPTEIAKLFQDATGS